MTRNAEPARSQTLVRIPRYPSESAVCDVHELKKRVAVFTEGSTAYGAWEVLEGTVILYKSLTDGRRQITEVVQSGGWVGTPALPTYSCSAETLTNTTLRFYSLSTLAASHALQSRLSEYFERRIEALQEHALLLGRKSSMERIASFLLLLPSLGVQARNSAANPTVASFCVALKQRDIGDYLGLKVETVSRNFAELKRRMIIATGKRGQFFLLDREALRSLAHAS